MAKAKKEKEGLSTYEKFLATRKATEKVDSLYSIEEFPYNERISTGSKILDKTIGGGVRVGMVRITSPRECGKTMFALGIAKNWQKQISNGKVVYIDAEARMFTTPEKLKTAGVDTSPDKWELHVENGYEFVAGLVDFYSDQKDERYCFIIDSVDALLKNEDKDKNFEESLRVGGGGTTASHMMKKTYIDVAKNGHLIILLSQHRDRLPGGSSGNSDGSGGNALSHWSSLILRARKIYNSSLIQEGFPPQYADGKKRVGHFFTVDILKSYNEVTGETVSVPIKRYAGVWSAYEALMMAEMWDLLERAGTWYNFSEEVVSKFQEVGIEIVKMQGKKAVMEFLESNPKAQDIIFAHIESFDD